MGEYKYFLAITQKPKETKRKKPKGFKYYVVFQKNLW